MHSMLPAERSRDAGLAHKRHRALLFNFTNTGLVGMLQGLVASSRASPLPQGYLATSGFCGNSCTPKYNASIPSSRNGSTPLSSAMRSMR